MMFPMYIVLHELLQACGLDRVMGEIEQAALPSLRLRTQAGDASQLELGTSKVGGRPDLPYTTCWPTQSGTPLPFVAQINLAEIAPYERQQHLPHTGVLFFFFDVNAYLRHESEKTYEVIYESSPFSPLQRTAFPASLPMIYQPARAIFTEELTLPDYSSYDPKTVTRLGLTAPLSDEEEKAYYRIQAQLAWTAGSIYHLPRHRLLGHPDTVQWEMYPQLGGTSNDWTLLLQVDSDAIPATNWGDTGRIYFWIPTKDVRQGDFSRVRLLLQS